MQLKCGDTFLWSLNEHKLALIRGIVRQFPNQEATHRWEEHRTTNQVLKITSSIFSAKKLFSCLHWLSFVGVGVGGEGAGQKLAFLNLPYFFRHL